MHTDPNNFEETQPYEDLDLLDEANEELAELESEEENEYDELATVRGERDQLRDQLLRSMADLQNVRKRAEQDRQTMRKFATEDIIRDLLPVLDNFERTIAASKAGASAESLVEGVGMVERQLRQALESRGLTRIQSTGAAYDPELHDAIGTDPATDETPAETVTVEIEPGYRLADRVIRAARVKVAR